MAVRKPEEWPTLFSQQVNAGDLEAVIELYEPGATFVLESGEVVRSHEGMRAVLTNLLSKKPRFESRVERCAMQDDIAMLYTNFVITMPDSSEPQQMKSRAIEILRRQTDGSWKLIIGDPNGRK